MSPLRLRAAQVCDTAPELRDIANECLRRIEAIDGSRFRWRNCPVHRDFDHDQVLIDGDTLAVLHLDDAAMSEPVIDVANFAAHLMLLGAQQRGSDSALAVLVESFIDQYLQLDLDGHAPTIGLG